MLNIEDTQVDNLANFMGHAKEVHKTIYRMPIPVKEMTDVSRLLEAAMGNDLDNEDNNQDCNNNTSDTDSVSQLSVTSEELTQQNNNIPDSNNDNFSDNTIEHSFSNQTIRNSSDSEHYSSEFFAFFFYLI